MSPAVHHVALRVRSPESSAEFYGRLLGLPEVKRVPDDAGGLRAIWLRAGSVTLMLERRLRGRGAETGSAHVLVLEIDILAEWEARLAGAGVEVDDRTDYTLYVRDPDGHRVGLTVYR